MPAFYEDQHMPRLVGVAKKSQIPENGSIGVEVEGKRFARSIGRSWRVDETYISIKGKWHYLYRAVDKRGRSIDFMPRPDRGIAAAQAFFERHSPRMRMQLRARSHWGCTEPSGVATLADVSTLLGAE